MGPLWTVLEESLEHGDFKHGDPVWTIAWDDGPHYWLEHLIADSWQTVQINGPIPHTEQHWVLKSKRDSAGCVWREEALMAHTKEEALEKALQWIKQDILENTEEPETE